MRLLSLKELSFSDGSITWTEPPPPFNASGSADKRPATTRQFLKGSSNVTLSWNFTVLSGSLREVDLLLEEKRIGDIRGIPFVFPKYRQRFAIRADEPATLIIFNVTETEGGTYTCQVSTTEGDFQDKIVVEVLGR